MMKMQHLFLRAILTVALVVLCVPACTDHPSTDPAPIGSAAPAANVILFVGDGMGPSVVGLAKDYARVVESRDLWMEKAISEGDLALVQVPALGTLATDSSAAATAMATGKRVPNKVVSVSAEGAALTTILELAEKERRSTGLVTTTRLTHATPACFAAHISHRDLENEIAELMLSSGTDVMLGGGLRHWIPQDKTALDFTAYDGSSKREDASNLVEKAKALGYTFVSDRDGLLSAGGSDKLLGLFASSHLPYALDRRPDDGSDVPSLVELTEAALDVLSKNENGFFLMVEGGRIDHAAHANDAASVIADALEFDEAVGIAMVFAEKQKGTTVFITADHVTGGPCLTARYSSDAGGTIYPDEADLKKLAEQDASTEYILTELAKNPSPAELKRLVLKHTGIEITDADVALILSAEPLSPFHVVSPRYGKFGYYAHAIGRVLGLHYDFTFATGEHFSEPVLLIGYGARADLARGYIENTDVFTVMRKASGL
jgi:alkaline phosphatase